MVVVLPLKVIHVLRHGTIILWVNVEKWCSFWKDEYERKFEGSDCNLVAEGLFLKFTFFFELLRGGINHSLIIC